MKKFLQKILCKMDRHVELTATARHATNEDHEHVIRIRVHCPACDKSMLWLDVASLGPKIPCPSHNWRELH